MAFGEIFVKLSVGFADDPKVRALARYGADAGLARDLYVQMVLYSRRVLTDGFIPAEQVGLLVYPLPAEHGEQLAKQLASVGLIKEISNLEAQGWQVRAYVKRNGTKEDAQRLSEVRAEAGRTGGVKSRKRTAQRTSKPAGKQDAKQVADQLGEQNGSNTVSVSVRPNGLTEDRDISQTPTVSAGEAGGGLTITQRSKRLTDAYATAEPMCKWPAVNAVVIRAIKAEKYADDEIGDALLRLAAENRSVTIDTLRTELQGFAASPRRDYSRGGAGDPLTDQKYGPGSTEI